MTIHLARTLVCVFLVFTLLSQSVIGAETDLGISNDLIVKAAEQGDALSQYALGLMYYGGLGVTNDYKEAVKWYRKAAEQGNADAQSSLGMMYASGKGILVEVTRTDPLEKLVWTNKKDPDDERNKILNRTEDPHPA